MKLSIEEKEHVVYWIKTPEMTFYDKEGYIGVTSNLKNRLSQHKNCCNNMDENYKSEFLEQFNSGNCNVAILFTGSRHDCYQKEYELRPNYNIGWNTRCGASPDLKLRDEVVSSAYRCLRYNAKKLGLDVCKDWKTTQGFYDFQEFYKNGIQSGCFEMRLPESGVVSKETVIFISKSEIVRQKHRSIDFFGDGVLYSNVELSEILNIEKPNTLATQRKRNWSPCKIFMKAWESDRLKNNA